jgi:hypothetical protein
MSIKRGHHIFVIAGHSRSQNGVTSLAYADNPWGRTAAWTTGSSPVVTK